MISRNESSSLLLDSTEKVIIQDTTEGRFNLFADKKALVKGLILCVLFTWLGISLSILGPTFLDLLSIVNEDIETGTIVLTAGSVGYVLGDLAGGLLLERFNIRVVTVVSSVLSAALASLLPLCSSVGLMAFVQLANWCANGVCDVCVHTLCVEMYGSQSAIIFQALHFVYSVGGAISPLIAEPFLSNGAHENLTHETILPDVRNNKTTFLKGVVQPEETHILMAYLILGAITLMSVLVFLLMFCSCQETSSVRKVKTEPITQLTGVKIILLAHIAALYFCYYIVETTMYNFLATYAVEFLQWSKSDGALLTTLYWASMAVGRFVGIFITTLISPWKMLAVNFLLTDIALLGFLLAGQRSSATVTVCSSLSGLGMSTIFAGGLSWVNTSMMPVTSRMVTFINVFASIGMTVTPMILGHLFDNFTFMWFVYITLGVAVLCTLTFVSNTLILFFSSRKSSRRN